jgi:hypothetical protein
MASEANGGAENGSKGLEILGKKLELKNRLAESRSPYVSLALTAMLEPPSLCMVMD